MDDLVGQSLGRYLLDKLLGKGVTGAVFRAKDVTVQCDVAVRVLHPRYASQPGARDAFLEAARSAERLDHPGIVRVLGFGHEAQHLYVVMELVAGVTLRRVLQDLGKARQRFSIPATIELARQVCQAVDHAREAGILLDVNARTIMLKPQPRGSLPYCPVITDLGLVRLFGGGTWEDRIPSDSLWYLSPEEARGEPADARTSVYAVGVLLYELTVGIPPFPCKTVVEAVRSHLGEAPPSPRALRPEIPAQVDRAILESLSKDPARRSPDCGALERVLSQIAAAVRHVGCEAPPASLQEWWLESPFAWPSARTATPIGLFLDRWNLPAVTGSRAKAKVTILNQGSYVDSYQLSVDGVPEEWVSGVPSPIRLLPGQSQEVTLTFAPPSSARRQAGSYPLIVRARSQDDPRQEAEQRVTLDVEAGSIPVRLRMDAALPSQVILGRTFDLAVRVRQPSSRVLEEEGLDKVRSGDVQIAWAATEPFVRLRVQVGAPECDIHGPDSLSFLLFRGQDSPTMLFQLTPRESGRISVVVVLYLEDDWLGGTRVHTEVRPKLVGRVDTATQSCALGKAFPPEERRRLMEQELAHHQRKLALLRSQKAVYASGEEPLHLLTQSADAQVEIQRLTAALQSLVTG